LDIAELADIETARASGEFLRVAAALDRAGGLLVSSPPIARAIGVHLGLELRVSSGSNVGCEFLSRSRNPL
jgi:hypothetical protein